MSERPEGVSVPIHLPDSADTVQRLELIAKAALDRMDPAEYGDRLELAYLDPDSAKLFIVKHDGPWIVVEWPAGCELIRVDRAEMLKTSADD